MTKKILLFILVLFLCVTSAVTVFADDVYVPTPDVKRLNDTADILTDAEEAGLQEKLDSITDEFKVELAIATVNGTGEMDVDEYVNYYFENSGLGIGDERDAVLILIDMDTRNFRILSNGKNLGAAAISVDDIDSITDKITSDLSDGNYASALHTFADACEYQINGQINGFPFKTGRNLIIAVVIGFIVALIITGSMKGKLKSVMRRDMAKDYVKNGSLNITESRDTFLYSQVTRTKRESKDSGSDDGASRNVGGGSF